MHASAASATQEALCFALYLTVSVPLQIFLLLRKNTERILMKSARGNHYYKQIKLLDFG